MEVQDAPVSDSADRGVFLYRSWHDGQIGIHTFIEEMLQGFVTIYDKEE